MKRRYVKPEMRVEKMVRTQIVCTSPELLNMNNGAGNQIENKLNIW